MTHTRKLTVAALLLAGLLAAGACLGMDGKPQAFSVAWNYDTSGYLETCGCSAKQIGGLARRGSKIAALRETQPVLAIEGAHIVEDKGEFQLFKGQMIVEALNRMDYSALMVGVREAQQGPEGLRKLVEGAKFPVFSANLQVDGQPWPTPVVETKIAGNAVAITGVSQPELVNFELADGMGFSDPAAALTAALAKAREADMKIVCLEGEVTWIEQMATQFKGQADLFLSGNRQPETANLEFVADPPRLNSFDRGRYMGLVTVDPAPDGFTFAGINVPLSDDLENLAAIQELLDKTYKPQLKDKFFAVMKQDLTQLFMPAEYCADCHQAEYDVYAKSGHAIALNTLHDKGQLYNPDCMKCHVTYDPGEDKLHSMNCVTCHTNITEDHVWQAMEGAVKVVKPEQPVTTYTYDWCYQCHDPLNSAEFEAHWPQYVNKIAHGGNLEAAKEAAKALGIDMNAPPPAHH
jgi:hypothetical protein